MFIVIFSAILVSMATSAPADDGVHPFHPGKVLFISFDGFRWDYLTRTDTPNFDWLIANGVTSDHVTSSFITKTFPVHYTLVTGLYQESHGFVGNDMYDPELNVQWSIKSQVKDAIWWDGGEPIWVTNQKQGFQSGVFQFPGMDIPIGGHKPTYRLPKYNGNLSNHEVIDLIIPLFANNSINLGVLYFATVEHAGHLHGPESVEMIPAIQESDRTMGYLITKLNKIGTLNDINIIVASDHGMTSVSNDNIVRLGDYINPDLCRFIDNNPVYGIWPYDDNNIETIYQRLVNTHPHMTVYKKADIPERFHYKHHRRIPPIIAIADEHWHIMVGNETSWYKGNHGYDNSLQSMQTLFVAHGPAFKKGYHAKTFTAVEYYPMMCYILGIKPAPNNGSLSSVMAMFASPGSGSIFHILLPGIIGVCAWLLYAFVQYKITTTTVRPHIETRKSGKKGL
ncbi:ectonucleotide pyrophosphatase/phosphodiesterase family member 5-like [Amphiura filiformis]|uniref:ectonucleotide pyrophosphatase/phosphodiesterase family member 5-like n=1 Tax=Amphiura filiformis TaxID=82378 RepID=UPI003B225E79